MFKSILKFLSRSDEIEAPESKTEFLKGQIKAGQEIALARQATFSGICYPEDRNFSKKEDRFKRYNTFNKKFSYYDSLSPEGKVKMQSDAISMTDSRQQEVYNNWEEQNRIGKKAYINKQFEATTCSSLAMEASDPDNVYVIPDCYYGCGTAPCGCTEDYEEYTTLKKEFEQ